MNENRRIYLSRILLIIFILAIVIATVVAIFLFVITPSQRQGLSNMADDNLINNVVESIEPDYTKLDEGISKEKLQKIELNEFAKVNSTIDGNIPCFYNPVIPQGFKAIGTQQDTTIDEKAKWGQENGYLYGLVIEDEKGNQFVWIPVENLDVFKTTDWQKNQPKETIDITYVEPSKEEEETYYRMYYKVKKYGGFYIGRYETGDLTATGERTEVKNSDSLGIRKHLNAYNYIPFKQTAINGREITGAQELAINFGKRNNYKTAVTSVVYGTQWDAMLRFIVSEQNNVNNSVTWGNYSGTELLYRDINGNLYRKESGETRLLHTGVSETTKAKNIYDIAGNLYEWTMETSRNETRVVRGGCYVLNIGQLAASRYAYKDTTANNAIGFRISFYVE